MDNINEIENRFLKLENKLKEIEKNIINLPKYLEKLSNVTTILTTEVNHLIESIKLLIQTKEELIRDVAKLNNVQKTWNDENYLNAWYKYGRDNLDHFGNYAHLWNLYNDVFDGLPCGFLVDLYAKNKAGFRTGNLEFRDKKFSDKLAQISFMLKNDYKKGSFTLQGLRTWAFDRKFNQLKDIDFKKLESRLKMSLKNNEDHYCNGRDDFKEFVDRIYKRL